MKMDIGVFEPVADRERKLCNTKAADELARQLFDTIVEAKLPYRDCAMALANVAANLIENARPEGVKVDGSSITLPAVICLWTSVLLQHGVRYDRH